MKHLMAFVIAALFFVNGAAVSADMKSSISKEIYDYTSIKNGIVFINGTLNDDIKVIITDDKKAWLPVRAIFENIGADVNWYDELEQFSIDYKGKIYIGYFQTNADMNPHTKDPEKYFSVRERDSGDVLPLGCLTESIYTVFDNSIYLNNESSVELWKQFGVDIDVYISSGIVEITKPDFKEDIIPDEQTALAVGKIILEKYADRTLEYEMDDKVYYLEVTFDKDYNGWRVSQTFKYKDERLGLSDGVMFNIPTVVLDKYTGKVLYIYTGSSFSD